ncbi:hypothetical protein ACFV3R_06895 [Streptomyces sp. NPDC059740]|uniref:hypothetical protein n=1 Tax=Streptomyces sp. NPDC059740 TaxID=3346926 RepID=UPI003661FB15
MDLLDWHRGRLTTRRLAVLVKHLPRDSATLRETDGEAVEWGVSDYLLAAVVDHLAAANWMFSVVNGDGESEPPEQPVPVPRPGEPRPDGFGADQERAPSPASGDAPTGRPTAGELMRFFG